MKLKCIRTSATTGTVTTEEHKAVAKIAEDRQIWIHLEPGVGFCCLPKQALVDLDPSSDWVPSPGIPNEWDSLTVPAEELERLREVLRLVPDPNILSHLEETVRTSIAKATGNV